MSRSHLALLVLVLIFAQDASARLIVFGDSLSDTGNALVASGGTVPNPAACWQGRASHGPVWVEYLADTVGMSATPSLAGGTNYAYYNAWNSGGAPFPSLQVQIADFLNLKVPITPEDRFIAWGGANDIFFGEPPDPLASAKAMLGNLKTLAGAGARNIWVLNLPPLGQTPELRGTPLEPVADLAASTYNASLQQGIDALRPTLPPDVTLELFDLHALFSDMLTHPADFGLTNVTDAALFAPPGTDVSGYMFWDTAHPTTTAHMILANGIPEPASMLLLAAGAAGLLARRRVA